MAEEGNAGSGIAVPGEGEGSSQNPEESHRIAVETKARTQGWKPLDDPDYKGDPADWVDAKEFVGRRPLFDTIHDLKRQLTRQEQRTTADMQVIAKQFEQMQEQAYKKALGELTAQRDHAIANQDIEVVRQLDKEIDEQKQQHIQAITKPVVHQPEQTPVMREWRDKNPWFDKDPILQEEAMSYGVGYMMTHQGAPQEKMLAFVEDRIKKIYPERFQTKTERKQEVEQEETSKVESSNTGSRLGGGSKKSKLTRADLPEEARRTMDVLVKRGALDHLAKKNKRTPEEEYLASYAANIK